MGTVFQGAYSSFSGVDIKAVFGSVVIAELQGVSYSITREKAPVYTMGSADPRSFSRGKRGIAGTLIFVVFDRHALLGAMGAYAPASQQTQFLSDIDDLKPEFGTNTTTQFAIDDARLIASGGSTRTASSAVGGQETGLATVAGDQTAAAPWYADQIFPFDITMAAANEYGALAIMRIFGVEILNEGFGISIDDVQSATQMTYVARAILGWKSLGQHPSFQRTAGATDANPSTPAG
jgi:hypothetical protein